MNTRRTEHNQTGTKIDQQTDEHKTGMHTEPKQTDKVNTQMNRQEEHTNKLNTKTNTKLTKQVANFPSNGAKIWCASLTQPN